MSALALDPMDVQARFEASPDYFKKGSGEEHVADEENIALSSLSSPSSTSLLAEPEQIPKTTKKKKKKGNKADDKADKKKTADKKDKAGDKADKKDKKDAAAAAPATEKTVRKPKNVKYPLSTDFEERNNANFKAAPFPAHTNFKVMTAEVKARHANACAEEVVEIARKHSSAKMWPNGVLATVYSDAAYITSIAIKLKQEHLLKTAAVKRGREERKTKNTVDALKTSLNTAFSESFLARRLSLASENGDAPLTAEQNADIFDVASKAVAEELSKWTSRIRSWADAEMEEAIAIACTASLSRETAVEILADADADEVEEADEADEAEEVEGTDSDAVPTDAENEKDDDDDDDEEFASPPKKKKKHNDDDDDDASLSSSPAAPPQQEYTHRLSKESSSIHEVEE
jgi:hypothetical protein